MKPTVAAAADAGDLAFRRFDSTQLAPGERFDRFRSVLAPVLDVEVFEDRPLADYFARHQAICGRWRRDCPA